MGNNLCLYNNYLKVCNNSKTKKERNLNIFKSKLFKLFYTEPHYLHYLIYLIFLIKTLL